MKQVKTLLLRFRDLVTSPGDTIAKHAAIAEEKGKVWWGWWSKQNEQVPLETFAQLLTQNRSAGFDIYLIDTGRLLIYKAHCTDIKYDNAKEKIQTPDVSLTPEYYKDSTYTAWFSLSNIEIEPIDSHVLNDFTYIHIETFFVDPSIVNYGLFENKIVSSILELKLQDRSIWFVREARPEDLNHEIQLAGYNKLQPTHFTKKFKNTTHRRILWFTDIHFGSTHGFLQSPTPQNQERSLWLAVKDVCEKARINDIAGVIVSGDITTHAKQEGFDNAYNLFFSPLCSDWTENDFYNWIICPGNHDLGFSTVPLVKGEEITQPRAVNTTGYSQFYTKLFNIQPNKFFCSGRRFLLGNTYPIEIIALNSVNLQQTKDDFQGIGYVGHEQLEFVEQQYNWSANNDKNKKPIRIVVLHHHLLPVTYTESTKANSNYSLTLDAESITRWLLQNGVTLVLHGHMHQPSISNIQRPITIEKTKEDPSLWPHIVICSLGSSGVKQELLGEISKNMFGVITFDNDEIQLEFYDVKSNIRPTQDVSPIYKVCLPI
jgi:3',5'-cyclic AMP phosphodiesterase CpdA